MSAILKKFRQLMDVRKIAIYILPRTDQHQSQYICPCDERVSYLSGFTGSNAIALVSQKQALLWTDSRYYLQAQQQLHEGWQMKKMAIDTKKWYEHIIEQYTKQTIIGMDSRLLSAQIGNRNIKNLQQNGMIMKLTHQNLIDQIWQNRPIASIMPIFIHQKWSGKTITNKIKFIRDKIFLKKAQAAIFNDLSQIGWILNLRSSEIPYNPFFKSILIITINGGYLYLPKQHPSLENQEVTQHLDIQNIVMTDQQPKFGPKMLINKSQLNYYIYSHLQDPIDWEGIGLQRAVRTEKQLDGFRRCHLSDGIAMAKFWSWRMKQQQIGEYQAAQYLDQRRFQQKHNQGLSFVTISGGGPNAAIVHYHPTKQRNSIITKNMIHLVDSGGQYLDGTTDVTRTFHFGLPTSEEKDAFTRVLLGNLDIERLKWPNSSNITGGDIDVLARRHLWAKGLDYGHGTGHGVGYFQGVHESPVGISKYNKTIFKGGMIVTNEPGYYETGKYGIRIQNMLVVLQQQGFYKFQNLTICPYDKNLLDLSLLTKEDINYINKYHQKVYNLLQNDLQNDKQTLLWLKQATSQIK